MIKKLAALLLLGIAGTSFAAIGGGPGGSFINNANTLQPSATFYVSSGTVTNLQTGTIKFGDGTTQVTATVGGGGSSALGVYVNGVQVSSPTTRINFDSNFTGYAGSVGVSTISLNAGSTMYIRNSSTLQTGTTFYVSSGTVNGTLSAFRGGLQAVLMPSTTEAFSLVNLSSHQVYVLFKSSGTNWWRVGNDVTNTGTPSFDIYNATSQIKDISISTNDVMTVNAGVVMPNLSASQPVKTNSSKQLITSLINLTSDVSGTLPSGNLPSNVDYTNVTQTISSPKTFTSTNTFGLIAVTTIVWANGTIQVSSPSVGGGGSMSPGATYYVNVDPLSVQSGAFNISSGTIDTGGMRLHGILDMDRPDLTGAFDAHSRLYFDPNQNDSILKLYSYYVIAPTIGMYGYNNAGLNVAKFAFLIGSGANYIMSLSSASTSSPTTRYNVVGNTGKQQFSDAQGNIQIEFDPVNNSSFTVRPIWASSETVNTALNLPYTTFGNCLQTDTAGKVVSAGAPCGSGGGGGTTVWSKLNGANLDAAVSTINIVSPLTATSGPSGQINLTVNTTTFLTQSSATATYIQISSSTNGVGQLVRLDGSGKLPAIDGSQLTNLPAGSGDMILAATQTASAPHNFANATTSPAIKITQTGNTGTTAGTSGAFVIDMTSTTGYGLQVYTNRGNGTQLTGMVDLISASTSYDQPMLYIKSTSTGTVGGNADIRIDANNPDIEFVEDDQGFPSGKFEIAVQSDVLQFNSRNTANNSFQARISMNHEGGLRFKESDNGGDFVGFAPPLTISGSQLWGLPTPTGVDNQGWVLNSSTFVWITPIRSTNTLQAGTTIYVTSGTITNLNVTNINGSSYPPAGGGGGASALAVGTGTAANYTTNITSPTAAISFLGSQFQATTSGTTSFIEHNPSSITMHGPILVGVNNSWTSTNTFTRATTMTASATNPIVPLTINSQHASANKNGLRVNSSGNGTGIYIAQSGSTPDVVDQGGLAIDNTGNIGFGETIYTNQGADQRNPLFQMQNVNPSYNTYFMMLSNAATGYPSTTIEMQAPIPSIEFRGTTAPTAPINEFQISERLDMLRLEGRKADNTGFESILVLQRPTTGAPTTNGLVGIAKGGYANPINALDVSGAQVIGTSYAFVSSAPANGLLVQGNVGISTTVPVNTLAVAGGITTTSSVTASAFWGDGSHLTGIPGGAGYNGNSSLAVGTGAANGYYSVSSTGTFVIVYDTTNFKVQGLTPNTTAFVSYQSTITTTGVPEGSNLYYTGARGAQWSHAIATGSPMGYFGVISTTPAVVLYSTTNFQAQLQGGATVYLTYRSTVTSDGVPQGSTNLYATAANIQLGLTNPTTMFIANGTTFQNANFNINTSSSMRVLTSSLSVVGGANISTLTITPLLDSATAMMVLNSSGAIALVINTSSVGATDSQFKVIVATTAGYSLTIGTATMSGPYLVSVSTAGHIAASGQAPAVSGCGTSPTINENLTDTGGTITPGATATGCTITFANAWKKTPHCVVSARTGSLTNSLSYTETTTALTLSETAFTSAFDYICIGAE